LLLLNHCKNEIICSGTGALLDDKCDVCGDRQDAQNPPNDRRNPPRCGRGFIAKEEQEQRQPYDSKNACYGAVLVVGVNRNERQE
jgi:hypothetical protein